MCYVYDYDDVKMGVEVVERALEKFKISFHLLSLSALLTHERYADVLSLSSLCLPFLAGLESVM